MRAFFCSGRAAAAAWLLAGAVAQLWAAQTRGLNPPGKPPSPGLPPGTSANVSTLFPSGEHLVFTLYWGPFEVGHADWLTWTVKRDDGTAVLRSVFSLRTNESLDGIYRVRAFSRTWAEPALDHSLQYSAEQQEDTFSRTLGLLFDDAHNSVRTRAVTPTLPPPPAKDPQAKSSGGLLSSLLGPSRPTGPGATSGNRTAGRGRGLASSGSATTVPVLASNSSATVAAGDNAAFLNYISSQSAADAAATTSGNHSTTSAGADAATASVPAVPLLAGNLAAGNVTGSGFRGGRAGGFSNGNRTWATTGPTLDPLAALVSYRTLPFRDGLVEHVTVCDGRTVRDVTVRVLRREKITTPDGPVYAWVVEPDLPGAGLMLRPARQPVLIWISDDAQRRPLRFTGAVGIGSFEADLVSVTPYTPPAEKLPQDLAAPAAPVSPAVALAAAPSAK